jgi:hypothetical protein
MCRLLQDVSFSPSILEYVDWKASQLTQLKSGLIDWVVDVGEANSSTGHHDASIWVDYYLIKLAKINADTTLELGQRRGKAMSAAGCENRDAIRGCQVDLCI